MCNSSSTHQTRKVPAVSTSRHQEVFGRCAVAPWRFALNTMTTGATLQTEKARRATRERMWTVARRRYQSGCLFKRGKRRKVWIARWREDVIRPDGSLGRIQRSIGLGLVSEFITSRQAQTHLDQLLYMLNLGQQRLQ